MVKFASMK